MALPMCYNSFNPWLTRVLLWRLFFGQLIVSISYLRMVVVSIPVSSCNVYMFITTAIY